VHSIEEKVKKHLRSEGLDRPSGDRKSSKQIIQTFFDLGGVGLAQAADSISTVLQNTDAEQSYDVYLSFGQEDEAAARHFLNQLSNWEVLKLLATVFAVCLLHIAVICVQIRVQQDNSQRKFDPCCALFKCGAPIFVLMVSEASLDGDSLALEHW
jgi:hypothetical protein